MECPPHSKESDRRNTVARDGDKSRSHRFSCGVAPSRERIESLNMNGAQKQHMKLEDLQANAAVRGILSDGLVTVVSVQWFGSEALELTGDRESASRDAPERSRGSPALPGLSLPKGASRTRRQNSQTALRCRDDLRQVTRGGRLLRQDVSPVELRFEIEFEKPRKVGINGPRSRRK